MKGDKIFQIGKEISEKNELEVDFREIRPCHINENFMRHLYLYFPALVHREFVLRLYVPPSTSNKGRGKSGCELYIGAGK